MVTIEEINAILIRVEETVKEIHSALYKNGMMKQIENNKNDIVWIKRIGGKFIWFFSTISIGIIIYILQSKFFNLF